MKPSIKKLIIFFIIGIIGTFNSISSFASAANTECISVNLVNFGAYDLYYAVENNYCPTATKAETQGYLEGGWGQQSKTIHILAMPNASLYLKAVLGRDTHITLKNSDNNNYIFCKGTTLIGFNCSFNWQKISRI